MKVMKKIVGMFVAFVVLFTAILSLASFSIDTYAAGTTKKVKSVKITNAPQNGVLTLTPKKTFKLKVKVTGKNISKKVKYKTSKKSIATVSKKGIIKGVKPGKATITVLSKANPKKKATLKVKVVKVAKKITLDGNKNTTVTASDYSYIEKENYVILLDKGVKICGDFTNVLDQMIARVETNTGMKFFAKDTYNTSYLGDVKDVYLKDANGLFDAVNPDFKKLTIVLLNDKEGSYQMSIGGTNSVVLSSLDYNFNNDGIYAISHELTHVILDKNMPFPSRTLTEGYAVHIGKKVARDLSGLYKSREWNYGYFPYDVTPDNAESLYLSDFSGDHDASHRHYQYGYFIAKFTEDTYGKDAYKKIAIESRKYVTYYWENVGEENEVKIIKKLLGNDFFTKFAVWYNQNKDFFDNEGC